MLSTRFETIKSIAVKRTPTTKPMLVNPTVKNPKHAQVLADSGINYDSPLTPSNVSLSRISEKKRKGLEEFKHL